VCDLLVISIVMLAAPPSVLEAPSAKQCSLACITSTSGKPEKHDHPVYPLVDLLLQEEDENEDSDPAWAAL
jgi:hypothetical protein